MIIAAHRGASDTLPENTIVALAAAVELGADFVEFDVRATRDERLVVIHDERLERTTDGAGRVAEKSLHELRAFDAGSWHGAEHAGRKVPTLNETLAVLKGTAPFIVDFKEEAPALVEELALSLRADDVLDKVLVTSPYAAALDLLAQKYSYIPLAVPFKIAFSGGEPVAIDRLRPKLLLARDRDADATAVAAAHGCGLKLVATLPRELDAPGALARAALLEKAGLDGIMTARARAFLAKGLRVM
jgi:glycerophosphoryl diester phosphodiesterase